MKYFKIISDWLLTSYSIYFFLMILGVGFFVLYIDIPQYKNKGEDRDAKFYKILSYAAIFGSTLLYIYVIVYGFLS